MVTNKSKRHFCCFFPIFKCTGLGWSLHSWKLNEISRCDQNNAADSDNLPLALVFEDVPLARFLQSDGAQVGSTFQRCYCVTKRLSASVVRPITLPSYACNRQSQQHISLSKQILLWPNKTCIHSEQALPPLHVWNHCFVFTLVWAILGLHCQVLLYKKFPLFAKRPHVQMLTKIS